MNLIEAVITYTRRGEGRLLRVVGGDGNAARRIEEFKMGSVEQKRRMGAAVGAENATALSAVLRKQRFDKIQGRCRITENYAHACARRG